MPTLYVTEPGARIEKEYHSLLVTREDEVLLRVPIARVTDVVVVGRAGVTTPALHALLNAGIPLTLLSRTGSLLGRLVPPEHGSIELRRLQFARQQEENFGLLLARSMVAAKLRNQRVLALRILRRRPAADRGALASLRQAEVSALEAESTATLRGIEGAGAAAYLRLYRQAFPSEWGFRKRTRRPPRDPVNALLSLGYGLLCQTAIAALEIVGLDPFAGYYHVERPGRPALALDLMEEFRAPLIDSLVMSVVNRRWIVLSDFDKGIRLSREGLRVYLNAFSDRLADSVTPAGLPRPLTYRKLLEVQSRRLARAIRQGSGQYTAFRAR